MPQTSEIHRIFCDCWNRRDFAGIAALLHPDYAYTGPDGNQIHGPDAGLGIAKMYAAAFPDGVIEIAKVFADGDTSIAEFTASGTHAGDLMGIPPTGKPVRIRVCNVMELRDGKVYREHEYMDVMTMMVQLGLVPEPAHAATM